MTNPPLPSRDRGTDRVLGWVLLVCGVIGLVAAFVLMVEKIRLLTNPFYVPSCSLNAALNCTSVMQSEQSSAFGFPNPLLGIGGFAVLVTVGVMVLVTGARLGRGLRLGLQAGVTAGLLFVHWLMVQTLFDIKAICPYCAVVWVVTIVAFCFVTVSNVNAFRYAGRAPAEVASGSGDADVVGGSGEGLTYAVPALVATAWVAVIAVLAVVVASGW